MEVAVKVLVGVFVGVKVAAAIVTMAPVEGTPVKIIACPFVPATFDTLNWLVVPLGAVPEILALACKVTAPPGGMTMLNPLKVAVVPEKVVDP